MKLLSRLALLGTLLLPIGALAQQTTVVQPLPTPYSTGTWIPADASGAGLTFTVDSATYTRVGNMVFASARLNYPVTVDASASDISGLPFSVGSLANSQSFPSNTQLNGTLVVWSRPTVGLPNVRLYLSGTSFTRATNAQLSNSIVLLTAIYQTN